MKKSKIFFILIFAIGIFLLGFSVYFVVSNNIGYEKVRDKKIKLELLHDDMKDLSAESTAADYKTIDINNPKPIQLNNDLIEKEVFYTDSYYKDLSYFIDYIKTKFNIELDSKWQFMIHLYDGESTGFVRFLYYLNDEISTNKSIMFFISENKVKRVTYSYLENKIDESLLINKVDKFKNNTIQEKKVLNENEKLLEEKVEFSYNFKLKKLIYSYNLFYENEDGIIYDDYGSVYFID